MDKNNKSTGSAVSLTTLLQVAFIVLKLCKVINWSWWWVLAPIWIDIALVLVCFGIYLLIVKRQDKEWRELMKKSGRFE